MAELYNIAAEIGVLGAILYENSAYNNVSDTLKPEDFYQPIHQEMYSEISKRIQSGKVADPVTMLDWAAKNIPPDEDNPSECRGAQYLITLADSPAFGPEVKDYAGQIKDYSTRRQAFNVLKNAEQSIQGDDAPADVIDTVEKSLRDIQATSTDKWRWQHTNSITDQILKPWSMSDCVKTGLKDLDDAIIGLPRKKPTVIAGRPGMGKSLVGASLAWRMAQSGVGVGIFSLEMAANELWQRMVCDMAFEHAEWDSHSQLYKNSPMYSDILKGTMPRDTMQNVRQSMKELKQLPIDIDETSGLRPADIHRWARRLARRYEKQGKELGVIIVDHLHRVKPPQDRRGNVTAEFSDIAIAFSEIAKDLNVALVELCQLNRSVENREDKHPMLSDLRESGTIEQEAQLIIGLCRPWYYAHKKLKAGDQLSEAEERDLNESKWKIDLDILKQRNGALGRVQLKCDAGANALRDLAPAARQERY